MSGPPMQSPLSLRGRRMSPCPTALPEFSLPYSLQPGTWLDMGDVPHIQRRTATVSRWPFVMRPYRMVEEELPEAHEKWDDDQVCCHGGETCQAGVSGCPGRGGRQGDTGENHDPRRPSHHHRGQHEREGCSDHPQDRDRPSSDHPKSRQMPIVECRNQCCHLMWVIGNNAPDL